MDAIQAHANEVDFPILYLQGMKDRLVDPNEAETFINAIQSKDKTLKCYPDSVHECFNDLNREQVMKDVIEWLLPRTGTKKA